MIKEIAKIFFAAIFIVTISACERQSCKNVTCPAGQNCNNGKCFCPDGYEGTDCLTLSNTKYDGHSFNVTVNCFGSNPPFGTSGYTAYMSADSDPRLIHISGLLGGVCSDIIAVIRTDAGTNQGNILEISAQNNNCGGITVSGDGTWYPQTNSIIFNLNISSGGTYNCQHTFYRQ